MRYGKVFFILILSVSLLLLAGCGRPQGPGGIRIPRGFTEQVAPHSVGGIVSAVYVGPGPIEAARRAFESAATHAGWTCIDAVRFERNGEILMFMVVPADLHGRQVIVSVNVSPRR